MKATLALGLAHQFVYEVFRVAARDDIAAMAEGTHERFVIDAERFNAKLTEPQPGA
jgi:predicted thioesterase